MSMWKYFFYPLMLLLLCYNNNLLADESDEPLYVNVLDTNSNFEKKLLAAMYNLRGKDSGISLQPIQPVGFADKSYKLTRELITKDNTNIKEEYILRLFHNTTFNEVFYRINIEEIPIYSSSFSNYLYIKIQYKAQSCLFKEGMLPFLNKNHLLLLRDNPEDKLEERDNKALLAMNELIDKAKCVSRQVQLHNTIKNPAILTTFTTSNITLLDIPDNSLFNFILYDQTHNITKLLTYMYNITSAVEFLHKNNIAVGDIDLTNLFILNGKLVLAKFESFNTINGTENKNSKIIMGNAFGHAPEIIIPSTGYKHNYYNAEATTSSDVYSLGTLFADILYLFTSPQFSVNDLIKDDTFDSVGTAEGKVINLHCFNRCPYQLTSRLQNKLPTLASEFFYNCKNFIGYYFRHLPEDNRDTIKKLTDMINLCNQPDPANRPTVADVKNMLDQFLHASKE